MQRSRIVYALINGMIAFIIFIILPLYFLPYLEKDMGVSIASSTLPYLGIMMVASSFISSLFKKTRYEGAGTIAWSLASLLYILIVFWDAKLNLSATTLSGDIVAIAISFPIIFYMLLAIPLLGIAKGIAMLSSDKRDRVKAAEYKPEKVEDVLAPHTD